MSLLGLIIFWSFIGSVASFLGALALVGREKPFTHAQTLLIISFAAGVLLSAVFFDLLPEAAQHAGGVAWGAVLAGIVFLFLSEKTLFWFHHHEEEYEGGEETPLLITIGDTIHNFIDGVAIAAAFMVAVPAGIVTALAVAAHEIPHEIADFGLLLSKGWSRTKTIAVNIGSAASSLLGAVLLYAMGDRVEMWLPHLMSFAAGMFVYLACSDLIPELHHCHGEECELKNSWWQIPVFLLGIVIVWGLVRVLE
ncbi:MAG: hypothetical protein UX78_C0005G0007 [Candidatus Amesbacteria bacterium GW2011_GWA2_47_11]|uniref:Zinc/iron permease n=1 Tax=Candidatus Amesbacteria bacterium GW2011_GWA2_47_11 TaxID=1618357 RepID=A0A0G1RHJ1_9BACT|nr:MAG: hypothetical protein UX78_C0005G0007 [Candidatus Amesbacteria bacterium GW2011_GWA2_47_11]